LSLAAELASTGRAALRDVVLVQCPSQPDFSRAARVGAIDTRATVGRDAIATIGAELPADIAEDSTVGGLFKVAGWDTREG